ncbi:uncharacterized protein [Ptychodera flava]|uniref:uncharacterized protein isoform X2 n=1 Tax=Ptychodera flava TaxID=63121 RepID=UPI003969C892
MKSHQCHRGTAPQQQITKLSTKYNHQMYLNAHKNAHGILLIPIIQRELNIFKDSIWNSHRSDHRGTLVYQLASRITSTIFQKSMTLKKVGGL